MASWRDQLQPASIRGVPCFVESSEAKLGRRPFRVEYPYRDDPFIDDMGRLARDYTLDIFLLDNGDGDDLFKQRTAMFAALEAPGPCTLIHPRLGALRVQVGECRWSASAGKNIEHFSVPLMAASDAAQPQVAVDTLDKVNAAADRAGAAQQNLLDKALKLQKQADSVIQGARADINRGLAGVKKLVRIGTAAADSVAGISQTIDAAMHDIGNLMLLPRTLASTVSTLIHQTLGLDNQLTTILSGYRAIGTLWFDAEPIPQTTPSRSVQKNNQAAIAQLFNTTATIAAARLVAQQAAAIKVTNNADSPFASAADAIAVRDELVAALDVLALTADDDSYHALVALQATVVAHIDAHGNTLPRVKRIRYQNTLPMLVIAHRLDGNLDREADLIARNKIRHPSFVAAGTELEVLYG